MQHTSRLSTSYSCRAAVASHPLTQVGPWPDLNRQVGPGQAWFTKSGKLILRKITRIVAIRCHILKLRCTKFDFGWSSAPDPAGELTAGFKGRTSKRKKGKEKGREGREKA